MLKKILLLAIVLSVLLESVAFAESLKKVELPFKEDLVYPVDFMGNGDAYYLSVPSATRRLFRFDVDFKKDGATLKSYNDLSFGILYITKLRGNKEDVVLLSNQGSGHFINAFKIFGYDGNDITILFDLFEQPLAPKSPRQGWISAEGSDLVLHYGIGGDKGPAPFNYTMIIRPSETGYYIADIN